jgi:uncharacterized membrane protein
MTRGWAELRPAAVAGMCLLAGIVGLGEAVGGVARGIVMLVFRLLAPGLALVPWFGRVGDGELALAAGISLGLEMAIGVLMAVSGAWSPKGALVALIAISLLGAVLQVAGPRRVEPG